jgi:hypothetical protein
MEKITLSVQLLNQVMGYLGTRPYQEVFQIINGLQAEAQAQATTNPISTETPEAQ